MESFSDPIASAQERLRPNYQMLETEGGLGQNNI
jgi:hypothetical protein